MVPYTDVQFIGYAIPTVPQAPNDDWIGNGPPFVEGRYIGIEPADADIDRRIELTMNVLEQIRASSAVDPSPSTLKIFVMPEFSFRGKRGAYEDGLPLIDYFTYFRMEFAKRVADPSWQGWLFVVGTIVNAIGYVWGQDPELDQRAHVREDLAVALANAWNYASTHNEPVFQSIVSNTLDAYTNYCRAEPLFAVTDRSYVVKGGWPDYGWPEGLSVQKKFIANEDFILNFHGNSFGEETCAYPPIKEHYGENKWYAFDDYSIFTIEGIRFGLEVCLDHICARLRSYREPDTELVQIQLVPSCGGQISQGSVIAGPGGLVFNCDGEYDSAMWAPTDTIWVNTASGQAHTQLAQVVTPCIGNNSSKNWAVLTAPAATVTVLPIDEQSASHLFAYGSGEVHIYTPLPVPPPVQID